MTTAARPPNETTRCRTASLLGLALLASTSACSQLDAAARRASAGPLDEDQQACLECAIRRHSGAEPPATDALPHFEARCAAGDLRACSVLGVMYEQGHLVERDEERAMTLFQHACRGSNASACVSLGRLLSRGEHRDDDAAELMFELGCDAGQAEGCYQLGLMRYQNSDAERARAPLGRACKLGHAAACEGLGAMLLHGYGVTPNPERAHALMRRACLLGSRSACERDLEPSVASARVGGSIYNRAARSRQ